MHQLQRICRQSFGGLAMTICLVATAFAQEDDIVGTWECSLSIDDPESGAVVVADFETTYDADGTYLRNGELTITLAAVQLEVALVMDQSGRWRLVDSTSLGETATSIEFSNVADPPSQVDLLVRQQMQEEANGGLDREEVTEITSLGATTITLTSADGAAMDCNKV